MAPIGACDGHPQHGAPPLARSTRQRADRPALAQPDAPERLVDD
jgi:hypothetical protein